MINYVWWTEKGNQRFQSPNIKTKGFFKEEIGAHFRRNKMYLYYVQSQVLWHKFLNLLKLYGRRRAGD